MTWTTQGTTTRTFGISFSVLLCEVSLPSGETQLTLQQLSEGAANLIPPHPPALPDAVPNFWALSRALGLSCRDEPPKPPKALRAAVVSLCQPRLGRCRAAAACPLPKVETQVLTLFFARKLLSQAASKGMGRGG